MKDVKNFIKSEFLAYQTSAKSVLEKVMNILYILPPSAKHFYTLYKKYVVYFLLLCVFLIMSMFLFKFVDKKSSEKQMTIYTNMILEMNNANSDEERIDIIKNKMPNFKRNIKLIASIELASFLKNVKEDKEAIEVLESAISCCRLDRILKSNARIHLISILVEQGDKQSLEKALKVANYFRKKDSGFYQLALQKKVIIYTMLQSLDNAKKSLEEFKNTIKDPDKYSSVFSDKDVENLEYFINNFEMPNEKR